MTEYPDFHGDAPLHHTKIEKNRHCSCGQGCNCEPDCECKQNETQEPEECKENCGCN